MSTERIAVRDIYIYISFANRFTHCYFQMRKKTMYLSVIICDADCFEK